MKELKTYAHLYLGCEEKWKNIPGYPYYKASSFGRIKSMTKSVRHNYGGKAIKKGKFLSEYITKSGYAQVGLTINGRVRNLRVHRLVALAFFGQPKIGDVVNHKDFNKLNNAIDNLEWCSQQHNVHHAISGGHRNDFGGIPFPYSEACKLARKKVILNECEVFDSVTDAAKKLGVTQSTVSQALRRGNRILKINTVRLIDAGLAVSKTETKK